MKYLIIDDNEKMRKLIGQTVCLENDSILECSDGEEAVSAYEKFLPDYVLMDIQMQKMDGISATRKITEKYPDARVIIITDYDTQSFRMAAKNNGAFAFIPKEHLYEIKEVITHNN